MTGIEKIRDRILQEANAYAKEQETLFARKADKVMKAARQEAEEKSKTILQQREREAEDAKRRLLAGADMEVKRKILEAKQALVVQAFRMAVERLCGMPRDKYCEMLANGIVEAVQGEEAEIVLSPEDGKDLGEELLSQVASLAQAGGKPVKVRLSERTADISGGFILTIGDIEMNYSFEALLRAKRKELEELAYSLLAVR